MAELKLCENTKVMGVINSTPDSFSDGGHFVCLEKAFQHAREMITQGVDVIDIGGESTRPGARAVEQDVEISRTIPLIKAIREISDIPISIDTNKPVVMQRAIEAGADIVNSVDALGHKDALEVVAELRVPVCLMHMQGTPETMQLEPHYDNVVDEVKQFLQERIESALSAGISLDNIMVDPGFGFGKTVQHNLQLLKSIADLKSLGRPLLVGLSRKRMIGTILDKPVDQRLYGSISAAVIAAMQGADIVRVHDVAETVDAIKIVNALNQV